jgi:hypothetical protein
MATNQTTVTLYRGVNKSNPNPYSIWRPDQSDSKGLCFTDNVDMAEKAATSCDGQRVRFTNSNNYS